MSIKIRRLQIVTKGVPYDVTMDHVHHWKLNKDVTLADGVYENGDRVLGSDHNLFGPIPETGEVIKLTEHRGIVFTPEGFTPRVINGKAVVVVPDVVIQNLQDWRVVLPDRVDDGKAVKFVRSGEEMYVCWYFCMRERGLDELEMITEEKSIISLAGVDLEDGWNTLTLDKENIQTNGQRIMVDWYTKMPHIEIEVYIPKMRIPRVERSFLLIASTSNLFLFNGESWYQLYTLSRTQHVEKYSQVNTKLY